MGKEEEMSKHNLQERTFIEAWVRIVSLILLFNVLDFCPKPLQVFKMSTFEGLPKMSINFTCINGKLNQDDCVSFLSRKGNRSTVVSHLQTRFTDVQSRKSCRKVQQLHCHQLRVVQYILCPPVVQQEHSVQEGGEGLKRLDFPTISILLTNLLTISLTINLTKVRSHPLVTGFTPLPLFGKPLLSEVSQICQQLLRLMFFRWSEADSQELLRQDMFQTLPFSTACNCSHSTVTSDSQDQR